MLDYIPMEENSSYPNSEPMEANLQNISQAIYLLFRDSDKSEGDDIGDKKIVRIAGLKKINLFRTIKIGNPVDFGIESPVESDHLFFTRIACAIACENAMEEGLDYIFIAYKPDFEFIPEAEIPLGQSIVLGRNCLLTHVDNIKYFEDGSLSFEEILELETKK